MTTTMMTIDEATAAVQRINHRKLAVPLSNITVTPQVEDEQIRLDVDMEGQQFHLEGSSTDTLLRVFGLSRKFLENCKEDPDLAGNALREAKRGACAKQNHLVTVSMEHNADISAFSLTSGKAPISLNMGEVWRHLRDKRQNQIMGIAEIANNGRGHYSIRLVNPMNFAPSRNVGDITQTGINISVNGTVQMNPFSYRLACTNGMQRREDGDILEINNQDPYESLLEIFDRTIETSQRFAEDFTRTDEVVVPNPTEYVMRSLKIAGGTDQLRSQVVDLLAEEAPNNTLYEILNIVTALGRKVSGDSPNKRDRIESVAGRVLAMQAGSGRCRSCNSQVVLES